MSTFVTFNDRLPDPTFQVNDAGAAVTSGGKRGPGFSAIGFRSDRPVQVSKAVSGRGVHRETGAHSWAFSISYNPMTRDDFDVVQSFLDSRNGKLRPFFVVLPQHSKPKDPAFATFLATNTLAVSGAHSAGSSTLLVDSANVIVGTAKPGDYLNIVDPTNVNHLKTYKVAAVETNATYQIDSTRPSTRQMRLHLMPPLTKNVANDAVVRMIDPLFRVYQTSDVSETELNTDNLYSFSLDLEEILP